MTFKIVYIEDNELDFSYVNMWVKHLNEQGFDMKIEHQINHLKFCKRYKNFRSKYDLILLDMFDEKDNQGDNVMATLHTNECKIPTYILSGLNMENRTLDCKKYEKYNFFKGVIHKRLYEGENLRIRLTGTIKEEYNKFMSSRTISFSFNEYDNEVNAVINYLGKSSLNSIMNNVNSVISDGQTFKINSVKYGYSGAIIFELKSKNNNFALKISNNKNIIENELKKLNDYKHVIDKISINNFDSYEDGNLSSILFRYVSTGITLFEWLRTKKDQNEIYSFMKTLFLDENKGMKRIFYEYSYEKKIYTKIFKDFDDTRITLFENATKELKPLIDQLDFTDLQNFLEGDNYSIGKFKKKTATKKKLLLCHRDFHSKNIMVVKEQEYVTHTIIDFARMDPDFWCTDICRLFVDLFLNGIDYQAFDYFDPNKIQSNIDLLKQIISINDDNLDTNQVENNCGFQVALKWLVKNGGEIYEDYCYIEFLLGLLCEFSKASYKSNSLPPNKRAVSLLAANTCFELVKNQASSNY